MAPTYPREIRIRRAPHDEVGTPDDQIERCSCGVLFRRGGSHRCRHVGEWVDWERYAARRSGA